MLNNRINIGWVFENENQVAMVLESFETLNSDYVPESLIKKVVQYFDQLSPKDKKAVMQFLLEEAYETKKFNPIRHLLSDKNNPIVNEEIRSMFKSKGRFFQNFERLAKCPKSWSHEKVYELKKTVLNLMTAYEQNHMMVSGPVLFPVLHKTLANCMKNKYIKF